MSLITNLFKDIFGRRAQAIDAEAHDAQMAGRENTSGDAGISTAEKLKIAETFSAQLEGLNKDLRRNSGYLARQEIRALLEKIRPYPKRLEQYGFKVYSQNDEDGILAEIFRRIGLSKGVFCEIGVENGLECNSLFLIHQGWRGVWFEGDPKQRLPIETKFQSLLDNGRLTLAIGLIGPGNINTALTEAASRLNVGANEIDFLSIDIDGMDIYLLEALEHFPKVICIEYNAKFPPPLAKQPVFNEHARWMGGDYMGSSLTAITDVAKAKGYSLVATNLCGLNAFFVRNDLLSDHFEENLSPEYLYNPPRYYLTPDYYRYDVGHEADFGPYTDLQ